MNRFSLFTFCSKEYRDALDVMLPSWLEASGAAKIYVYTDFDYPYDDKRVVIINEIDNILEWLTDKLALKNVMRVRDSYTNEENSKPTQVKWLASTGMKAYVFQKVMRKRSRNLVYIDVDCYVKGDISHVFDQEFDIATTRMGHSNPKVFVSSGIVFLRNNPDTRRFVKQWQETQEENIENNIGVRAYSASFQQRAYDYVIKNTECALLPLEESIYNSNRGNNDRWIQEVTKDQPLVLHFKGRRWRNKQLFKMTTEDCYKQRDQQKITVVLVLRSGGRFGLDDVKLLARKIHRTSWVDLVCMSDMDFKIDGVERIPLDHNYPGWWSRMELYSPRMREYRPFLYVDLDTAVLGSLNELVEKIPCKKTMYVPLEDFYQTNLLATGLLWMPLESDKINWVWVQWMKARCPVSSTRMDYFLRQHIKPDVFWQELTQSVKGFKKKGGGSRKYLESPNGASVVCFHGKPSIWDAAAKHEWIKEYVDE